MTDRILLSSAKPLKEQADADAADDLGAEILNSIGDDLEDEDNPS